MANKKEAKDAAVEETGLAVQSTQQLATGNEEVTDLSQLSDLQGLASRPSELDPHDLSGTEDIGVNDVRLPRLAIAQGLSTQVIPGDSSYIEGLKLFDFFNDVTGTVYGPGPIVVVPVRRHIHYIEFDANDRRIPLDLDVPPGDARTKWTKDPQNPTGKGIPPAATEFGEFICYLLRPGHAPEPIVVSIKTTNKWNKKAVSDWTTFIKLRGTAIYTGMYHLLSKPEKNDSGTFGTYVVKNAGFIPVKTPAGAALWNMAKKLHDDLEGKVIIVSREAGADDFNPSEIEAQGALAAPGM